MLRIKKFILVALLLCVSLLPIFSDSTGDMLVLEKDDYGNTGLFVFQFIVTENIGKVMIIAYFPLQDIYVFMPEFYVEQANCSQKYDGLLGYGDEAVNIIEPKLFDFGEGIKQSQKIVMYVSLPDNFNMTGETKVVFQTLNDTTWVIYPSATMETVGTTYWYNNEQVNVE